MTKTDESGKQISFDEANLLAVVEKLCDVLSDVWYSEFSNSETCMEGAWIKEALSLAQPYIKKEK